MPEDQPTIPQIVRALNTLSDRHNDEVRDLKTRHEQEMKELKGRFETVDMALLSRDLVVDELERVIATLCSRIERTHEQLKRDNQQCVYSEPLELMNLLGRSHDPLNLTRQAREKARDAKRKELERQEAEQRKREAEDAVREMIAAGSTQCMCGKWWKKDVPMSPGHSQEECFRPCRVCGCHEDRHTEELPEEGGRNYCAECSGSSSTFVAGPHTYDGAISAEWDVCLCGHGRREHVSSGPRGAYCKVCRTDRGRLHTFAMKV